MTSGAIAPEGRDQGTRRVLRDLADARRGDPTGPGLALASQLDAVEAAIQYAERLQQGQLSLRQQLSRARTAIRSALAESTVPDSGPPRPRRSGDDVFTHARTEVCFTLTLPATAECLRTAAEQYRSLAAQGIALRAIYPLPVIAAPGVAEHLELADELGVRYRFAPAAPVFMAVIDRAVAFVAAGQTPTERTELVFRDRDEVGLLAAAFEQSWSAAGRSSAATPGVRLTAEQLTVLRTMSSGAKDEAIARELGISPRTLTRVISSIMDALDARSRFEAGARASRLGLLD
ncbi:helix-turn-helix transcriptional regulator [Actinokineospora enzanensis]|uniref:helix-turn-helix transcriptional regulator n=1 Tax=Actinokineospora enzanensis TaxID=155975 RepID=UPI000378A0CC|nr:LuxR C-terminal-related transcriptional regulator [Actinokineospora enzanensis]